MTSPPEQTFFPDPGMDRALGMIMTLAAELHVARDHSRVLEALLVEKGILDATDVDNFRPDAECAKRWDADRDAFINVLMEHVGGEQVSVGLRK